MTSGRSRVASGLASAARGNARGAVQARGASAAFERACAQLGHGAGVAWAGHERGLGGAWPRWGAS